MDNPASLARRTNSSRSASLRRTENGDARLLDALFTNALLQSVNNDRGCNGENVISPCQALWYYHTQQYHSFISIEVFQETKPQCDGTTRGDDTHRTKEPVFHTDNGRSPSQAAIYQQSKSWTGVLHKLFKSIMVSTATTSLASILLPLMAFSRGAVVRAYVQPADNETEPVQYLLSRAKIVSDAP